MRPPVALAALLALPGCLYGMCGPTVGSVEGTGSVDAAFDGANRTRYADALQAAGFTRQAVPYDDVIVASRGDASVQVMAHFWPNATTVRASFAVPQREFGDSAGGHGDAEAYARRMAEAHQAEAQAIHDLLADAAGVPRKPMGELAGAISIC